MSGTRDAGHRVTQLPEVPTMEQSGYPEVNVTFWIGMLAPAGTPQAIVQKLGLLSQTLLQDEKSKAALSAQGNR